MTILSDKEIMREIKSGNLKMTHFEKSMLGPDSIDIRLGDSILEARKIGKVIDPRDKKSCNFFSEKKIDRDGYVLKPQSFVLGHTLERIGLPNNIAAQIEGRSSIGRLGIVVHMTAGIIHAGFGGKEPSSLTLEISSVNPNEVLLFPGMKIAQLTFFRLGESATLGYDSLPGSKYIKQLTAEAPRSYMEQKLEVEKKKKD